MPIEALMATLGENGLLTPLAEMQAFTEDWRRRYRGPAICVVLPANTSEWHGDGAGDLPVDHGSAP